MKILVIDDKANQPHYFRAKLLSLLQDKGIEVDIIPPEDDELANYLQDINTYQLIFVDYKFEGVQSSLFRSGVALYSLLRERVPETPIYLISVMHSGSNLVGDFDLFIDDDLLKDPDLIAQEINDHESLKNVSTPSQLIRLLCAPDDLKEEMNCILEPIFKRDNKNTEQDTPPEMPDLESLNLRIFRWFIEFFIRREGPTVSSAGAALLLGVSTDYFKLNSHKFEKAAYKGIFRAKSERWWASLLEDIVLLEPDKQNLFSKLPFKEAASQLLGASPADLSTCIICDEHYPEAIGYLDDDTNPYHVHISCSQFDAKTDQKPFFTNYRVINGE